VPQKKIFPKFKFDNNLVSRIYNEFLEHSTTKRQTIQLKHQQRDQIWWCMPLIPATQEAQAGRL
jgi:hypothetical protein